MEIVIPVAIESYGILPFNKPLKTSLLFDCMCSLRNLASLLQLSLAERAGRIFDSFLAVHCYRSLSLGVPGACSEHGSGISSVHRKEGGRHAEDVQKGGGRLYVD